MAADAKGALAAVGVLDSQNCGAVSPGATADVVNDTPWCCKIGELPTDQFPYLVGAASGRGGTAKRLPGPATRDTAGGPATCGPDEGSGAREPDRQGTGIAGCCECDAVWANCGRSSCCVEVMMSQRTWSAEPCTTGSPRVIDNNTAKDTTALTRIHLAAIFMFLLLMTPR